MNTCGGGEWLASNVIDSLRSNGHKVIVLTDERINQEKFFTTFGQKLNNDGEIVFPFHLFKRGELYNLYTDVVSCLLLKSKCNLVIDTYTRLILPGVDIVYIHYPLICKDPKQRLLTKLKTASYLLLYNAYQRKLKKENKKLVFANSNFTSEAIRQNLDINADLLYPPISPFFTQTEQFSNQRKNQVVAVSRFAKEKNLEIIPLIALRLPDVSFIIAGVLNEKEVYLSLKQQIAHLGLQERVLLMADVPKPKIREILRASKIYIHCAENEHFGISIIEAMACGCIPVTHDSGGPKETVPDQYRYQTIDEAAEIIKNINKTWSVKEESKMRSNALRFSQESFSLTLLNALRSNGYLNEK
jgi:glycosyltransferase involved in cell wall biosynthesis